MTTNLRACFSSDIVRDFALAANTAEQLKVLQRDFVSTILKAVNQAPGKQHATIAMFASSPALIHSVRGAVDGPIIEDKLFCAWLKSDSSAAVEQVVKSLPLADLEYLAKHFSEKGEHWDAAKLLYCTYKYKTIRESDWRQTTNKLYRMLDEIDKVEKTTESGSLIILQISLINQV
jgi:hypothetical protein